MSNARLSSRRPVFTTAALLAAALVAPAAWGQQAYFSFEGDLLTAGDTQTVSLDVLRNVSDTETFFIQTFTGGGGTNAAGDVIVGSGFDSVISLNEVFGGTDFSNDDGASTTLDSLLSFPGLADSGGTFNAGS